MAATAGAAPSLPLSQPELESLRTLEIPVSSADEAITVDLDTFAASHPQDVQLLEHDDELLSTVQLFETERAKLEHWVRLIEELWRVGRCNSVMQILGRGIDNLASPEDRHVLFCMRANYLLAIARKAPKVVLPQPRGGPLLHSTAPSHPECRDLNPSSPPLTKEEYWNAARTALDQASKLWHEGAGERERSARAAGAGAGAAMMESRLIMDLRAALFLARGGTSNLDSASRLYDKILLSEPTNLMALMGKARCLFSRRSFRPALRCYQQVLQMDPAFLPDPRIGVGMCLSLLGEKERGRKAWERSAVVHPTSPSTPLLLLGLSSLNSSKDPTLPGGEVARSEAYKEGMENITKAFKLDNTLAAAAAPLAAHFLLSKKPGMIKLAERAIQFADTRLLLSEGHLVLARALQLQGGEGEDHNADQQEYKAALDANPEQFMAGLAVAQGYLRNGDYPPAVNQYETILRRQPRCLEALVSLASINTHLAFTYRSASDAAAARKKAKELYDQILRMFASGKEGGSGKGEAVNRHVAKSERVRMVAGDAEMFVEIARLWDDEGAGERSLTAYLEAARIKEEDGEDEEMDGEGQQGQGQPSAQLLNNIGVLQFQQGHLESALASFERALTEIGTIIAKRDGVVGEKEEAVLVPCTFNRGVVLESLGRADEAKECYESILGRHSEYVEAKARLALVAIATQGPSRNAELDVAHRLIKEALTSQPNHSELRALYSYFLIETGSLKISRDFSVTTLKDNRHDVYALCAAGLITYLDAREIREPHPDHPQVDELKKKVAKERHSKFLKAAEYFDKALQLYPQCAFAAQGLAIGIAENTLGTGMDSATSGGGGSTSGGSTSTALTPAAITARNTRDALSILTKVKESVNDASVYINIGHCHFAREEWERAIESYETAAHRYHKGKSISSLLYLARAWYHKAIKDSNFGDFQKALESCQAALALNPTDLASQWNVALVQQKGAEVLFGLPVERRSIPELELALADAQASQATFEKLEKDPNPNPPYQKTMPRLRHRYGEGVVNRAQGHFEAQRAYDETEGARLRKAKEARDEERARLAAEEAERRQAQKDREEAIAEQRRKMREEAQAWALSKKWADSDEDEKETKKREKKAAGAGAGGKKRSKKAKADEEGASGSEEDEPKPKKKRTKAKGKAASKGKDRDTSAPAEEMELDEDGEEAVRGGNRRKGRSNKPIKSAEFVDSDSDEED